MNKIFSSLIFGTFKSENQKFYIYFLYIRKTMAESTECHSLNCPFMCCNMYGKCPNPTSTDPKQNQCWDPNKNMPLLSNDNNNESNDDDKSENDGSNSNSNCNSNSQNTIKEINDQKEGQPKPTKPNTQTCNNSNLNIILGATFGTFAFILICLIVYMLWKKKDKICIKINLNPGNNGTLNGETTPNYHTDRHPYLPQQKVHYDQNQSMSGRVASSSYFH